MRLNDKISLFYGISLVSCMMSFLLFCTCIPLPFSFSFVAMSWLYSGLTNQSWLLLMNALPIVCLIAGMLNTLGLRQRLSHVMRVILAVLYLADAVQTVLLVINLPHLAISRVVLLAVCMGTDIFMFLLSLAFAIKKKQDGVVRSPL